MASEFEEIGHSGGKITFIIKTDENGRHSYQVQFSGSRPVPLVITAVYASTRSACRDNQAWWNRPAMESSTYPRLLSGVYCLRQSGKIWAPLPRCSGYWRSGPWPNVCPYCATIVPCYQFLSEAQLRYVRHYCNVLSDALDSLNYGEVVIDMDVVADAAGKDGVKPAFTYPNKANSANSPVVPVGSSTIYWDVLATAPCAERVMIWRTLKVKQYRPFAPTSTMEMPQRIALGMRWHHLILTWLRLRINW